MNSQSIERIRNGKGGEPALVSSLRFEFNFGRGLPRIPSEKTSFFASLRFQGNNNYIIAI